LADSTQAAVHHRHSASTVHMMIMMMMIVDLYSALRRAPLLRYMSRCICEKECLQCWSKRSDAERWITEMIRQHVPDHRTCHGKHPTSERTATMTWYDQLMAIETTTY